MWSTHIVILVKKNVNLANVVKIYCQFGQCGQHYCKLANIVNIYCQFGKKKNVNLAKMYSKFFQCGKFFR